MNNPYPTIQSISIKVGSGITPLRSNPLFWENGTVPWLKTEQLGEYQIFETNEHISQLALEETGIRLNPINTVAVAMYGEGKTRGNVSILKSPMTTNQACCNIVVNPNVADYRYVYYWLKNNYHQLRNLSSGVRKNLNADDIKNFPFKYREIHEQEKIADVLSALDEKISINQKINHEIESIAKAVYDFWFVQFDFPDSEGKPYRTSGGKMVLNQSLNKQIPEAWNGGTASDLLDFNPTLSLRKGQEASYIDMDALPVTGYMTGLPERKAFSGGIRFQNGDVVVARITPCLENGKTGLITLLDEGEIGFGSTEYIVIRGKRFDLRCFTSCLARNEHFRKYAISRMTGTSGRKRVDYTDLADYKMPIPTDDVLQRFERFIGPLFQITSLKARENMELAELRDWALPMLMSGQLSVVELRNAIGTAKHGSTAELVA